MKTPESNNKVYDHNQENIQDATGIPPAHEIVKRKEALIEKFVNSTGEYTPSMFIDLATKEFTKKELAAILLMDSFEGMISNPIEEMISTLKGIGVQVVVSRN